MLGDSRVEDELIDTIPIATVPIARVEDELIALGHGCERVGDAHKRIEVQGGFHCVVSSFTAAINYDSGYKPLSQDPQLERSL